MQLSMWSYPWDLEDLGLDFALGELRDTAGLNTISLATSYHAGRFLQPRSPVRKAYFPEDGTIYFKPNAERWADVAMGPRSPRSSSARDILGELVERRDAGGMAVSCWTVCLHNTRLGMAYPHADDPQRLRRPQLLQPLPLEPRRARLCARAGRGRHAAATGPTSSNSKAPVSWASRTSSTTRRTASA